MLVRDKDSFGGWRIREAIRIVDRPHGCDCLQSGHIDHGHLVVTSHRSVDSSNFGNCNDAVYSTEPVEVGDDLTFSYIEDHELIGVHVRYVKPAMLHIEALIVEADCGSRHGNTCDCREHLITRRCWWPNCARAKEQQCGRSPVHPFQVDR